MAGGHNAHGDAPKLDLRNVYRPPTAPKTLPKVGWALYKYVFRRNSTFIGTMIIGAILAEGVVSWGVDSFWNRANKGKQWKDVKDSYEKSDK